MVQHDESGLKAAPVAPAPPAQPASKAGTAAPQLNNEVELGELPGAAAPLDIMHLARTGDVAMMDKLFTESDYDATYTDNEGITPLHVCFCDM